MASAQPQAQRPRTSASPLWLALGGWRPWGAGAAAEVLAAVAAAAPLRAEIVGGLVDGSVVHHALTLALTSPELEASGFDPLGAVLQAARARAGLDRPELLGAPDGAGVTPLARVRAGRARRPSPAQAACAGGGGRAGQWSAA
jgi:hypothetical protein